MMSASIIGRINFLCFCFVVQGNAMTFDRYKFIEDFDSYLNFHVTALTWNTASEACNKEGGDLVVIDSVKKQKAIEEELRFDEKDWWIGLNDLKTEGTFEWINGAQLGYKNWMANQPDNISIDGHPEVDCTLIGAEQSYKWFDRNCNYSLPFICERNSEKCPSPCFTYMKDFKRCIKLFARSLPWDKAKIACENDNTGRLLTLDSQEKHQAISKKIRNLRLNWWIGASRNGSVDTKWTNGKPLQYTNWLTTPPYWYPNLNCVMMRFNRDNNYNGQWMEEFCNSTLHFICETFPVL